jgi:hypothetical protein
MEAELLAGQFALVSTRPRYLLQVTTQMRSACTSAQTPDKRLTLMKCRLTLLQTSWAHSIMYMIVKEISSDHEEISHTYVMTLTM